MALNAFITARNILLPVTLVLFLFHQMSLAIAIMLIFFI